MKLSGLYMKLITICILSVTLLISCSTNPEPLRYGTDVCHVCKMTLMDRKFGAEMVTHKGKVFKFDDTNCFVNFINTSEISNEGAAHLLIVDFTQPEKLIPAKEAFYIKSEKIKSPMASKIAAFERKSDMDSLNNEWKGILLSWGELITEYK